MPAVIPLARGNPFPDTPAFLQVNDFVRHTGWLHAPLLLAAWWIARQRNDPSAMAAACWAPLATVAALALNQPIVNDVHEARPYTSLPHLLVLAQRSTDFSFPSDHATMAGAVTAGVFLVSRRLGLLAALAALLMAFARVYIAAHYPHDVLAGLVLGATLTLIGYALLHGLLTRVVERLTRTPLRPLLTSAPSSTTAGSVG